MVEPFVTIIIPTRNEEIFISKCLDTLLENDYPKDKIEIFVIDGSSTDNTLSIVRAYVALYPLIKIFSNPGKVFPSAVNIGIKESHGDLIFIAGAHAQYEKEYISQCVKSSIECQADNVGGILITCALEKTFIGSIISFVLSSQFGVGNSRFRTGSGIKQEVDTVFGGCYKRDVFDRIGLFNENLISTSDYEFNKRLRRNGGKIILDPGIKVTYYTRTKFKLFVINNFRNGFWSIYPLKFLDYFPIGLRHLVPLLFFLFLIGSIIFSLIWPFFLYSLCIVMGLYLIMAIYSSAKAVDLRKIIVLPAFFFLLHTTYGLGSFVALIKVGVHRLIK